MYLLVGLGNPGKQYENTFHNAGFIALDGIAEELRASFTKKTCKALVAETFIGKEKVLLAKPQTFMNSSGESVRELVNFYKIPLSNIMVFYDDYDIPVGALRIRAHGSAGTHNGMRSIVKELGSGEFPRARIGIKPQTEVMPIIEYVLSSRSAAIRQAMLTPLSNAQKAAEMFVRGETIDKIGCECNINL